MSRAQPIESLLCVATTPAQAKALLATLMAAGIPARTDGEALADEYAASMRLMNLLGTKVYVPTGSLARARAMVQPDPIDDEELTRLALAADDPEQLPRCASDSMRLAVVSPRTGSRWLLALVYALPLLAAVIAAAVTSWA